MQRVSTRKQKITFLRRNKRVLLRVRGIKRNEELVNLARKARSRGLYSQNTAIPHIVTTFRNLLSEVL